MKLYIFRIFLLLTLTTSNITLFANKPADATKMPLGEQIAQLLQSHLPTGKGKVLVGLLGASSLSFLLATVFLALKVRSKNGELELEKEKSTNIQKKLGEETGEKLKAFEDGKNRATELLTEAIYKKIKPDVSDENAKNPIELTKALDVLIVSTEATKNVLTKDLEDLKKNYNETLELAQRNANKILPDEVNLKNGLLVIPDTMTNGSAKTLLVETNELLLNLKNQIDTLQSQLVEKIVKLADVEKENKQFKKLKKQNETYKRYIKLIDQNKREIEYEEVKTKVKQKELDFFESSRPGERANVNHPFFKKVDNLNHVVQVQDDEEIKPLYKYVAPDTHDDNIVVFELITVENTDAKKPEIHLEFLDYETKQKLTKDDSFYNICLERAQSSTYKINPDNDVKHVFIFVGHDQNNECNKEIVNNFIGNQKNNENIKDCALFGENITKSTIEWLMTEKKYKIESFAPAGLGQSDRDWMQTAESAELLNNVKINYNQHTDVTDSGNVFGNLITDRSLKNYFLKKKQIVNVVVDEVNFKEDVDGKYIDRQEPFKRIAKDGFAVKAFYAFPGLFYGYFYHFKKKDIQLFTNYRYTSRPGRGYLKANVGSEGRINNDRGYSVFSAEKTADAIKKYSTEPNKFSKTSVFETFVIDAEREKNDCGEGKFLKTINQQAQGNIVGGMKKITEDAVDITITAAKNIISTDYKSYGLGLWNNIPSFDDLKKTSSSIKKGLRKKVENVSNLLPGNSIDNQFDANGSIVIEVKSDQNSLYPQIKSEENN